MSATNVIILIVMAGGNFVFGIVAYIQEFQKMDCVNKAIYHNMTEIDFFNCLNNSGLFDINGTNWIFAQFVLIVISIVIASIIEGKKNKL